MPPPHDDGPDVVAPREESWEAIAERAHTEAQAALDGEQRRRRRLGRRPVRPRKPTPWFLRLMD